MRTNIAVSHPQPRTHEGALAPRISKLQELRRSVMSCMLWENEFYEDGVTIADRIATLARELPFEQVAKIAVEAREKMKLRHVPLWLAVQLTERKNVGAQMGDLVTRVVQRADELTEFLSLYWKRFPAKGRKQKGLTKQIKRGLALAFQKFDEYQLAKYDRAGAVRLRDALFLCHAKPRDEAQKALWGRLINNELTTPDTWEVALSGGADKKATFERLMAEGKLGGLAFVRNLRNMREAGIDKKTVLDYVERANLSMVLPFRFIAAARVVPQWEDVCDKMLFRCASQLSKLPGKTVVIIDVSGSMYSGGNVSKHSDMTRVDAAGALAAVIREQCEDVAIYATAGDDYRRTHATKAVPSRRGVSLVDVFSKQEMRHAVGGGGIFMVQCMDYVAKEENGKADRVIVLTDEQDTSGEDAKLQPDKANAFGTYNYLINVASARNGIGYGKKWLHIDGWSEHVVEYILANEVAAN